MKSSIELGGRVGVGSVFNKSSRSAEYSSNVLRLRLIPASSNPSSRLGESLADITIETLKAAGILRVYGGAVKVYQGQ